MTTHESTHGFDARIADLKAKLRAREGKAEYKENCEAIRKEITRLEHQRDNRGALEEFVADEAGSAAGVGDAKDAPL